MSTPTPEAYEAARIAAADTYYERTGLRSVSRDHYVHVYARAAVDAVWPIAEATVRAAVAAEIRATAGGDGWPSFATEWAARIAEGGERR